MKQSKSIKFLVILLLITFLPILLLYFLNIYETKVDNQNLPDEIINESEGIKYYRNVEDGIIIVKFTKGFEYIYTKQNSDSLMKQAENNNYSVAVNASFFNGTYSNAGHAGFLKINDTIYATYQEDNQLTHVAVYNQELNKLQFLPVNEFDAEDFSTSNFIYFQSGPQIIKNNSIDTDSINSSKNGNGTHLRTAIGYLDNGEMILIVTTKRYKLAELGEKVKSYDFFENKLINLLNLDGGPSTAIYSKQFEQFTFNEKQNLPLIIGVK